MTPGNTSAVDNLDRYWTVLYPVPQTQADPRCAIRRDIRRCSPQRLFTTLYIPLRAFIAISDSANGSIFPRATVAVRAQPATVALPARRYSLRLTRPLMLQEHHQLIPVIVKRIRFARVAIHVWCR